MRPLITTILLVLALAFIGAGIPLYMDSLDLDFDFDFSSPAPAPLSKETPTYSLETQESNDQEITLAYTIDLTNVSKDDRPSSNSFLEVDLFYAEEKLRRLTTEELALSANFEKTEEASYAEGTVTVFLDALKIPDGDYMLKLHFMTADGESLIPSQDFPLTLSSIKTYEAARWEAHPQTTPLQLYFPEESYEQLIPITRFIPQTNTTLRGTVTQLEQGPADDLGLVSGSPIPSVPRIQLSGGVTSLYLTNQLEGYNENESIAKSAVYSLVESLGFIPEVREIQFYFNNQILGEGFLGIDTSQRFYPSEGPAFYPAYVTEAGRGFLYPVYVDEWDPSNLLENLSYRQRIHDYNHRFQPTLPSDVLLLGYDLAENTLELNFNTAFAEFISEAPVRGRMMMDSILLTAGSLPEVDLVHLLVEGSPRELIQELDTADPIPIPVYVNPEN